MARSLTRTHPLVLLIIRLNIKQLLSCPISPLLHSWQVPLVVERRYA